MLSNAIQYYKIFTSHHGAGLALQSIPFYDVSPSCAPTLTASVPSLGILVRRERKREKVEREEKKSQEGVPNELTLTQKNSRNISLIFQNIREI